MNTDGVSENPEWLHIPSSSSEPPTWQLTRGSVTASVTVFSVDDEDETLPAFVEVCDGDDKRYDSDGIVELTNRTLLATLRKVGISESDVLGLIQTINSSRRKGRELAAQLVNIIERHVALPAGAATAIALWIMFTYTIDAFDIAPILAILSPMKGCGKSTLVLILRALVWNPQVASNISPAALFRVIEKQHPTLLIDEIDTQLSHRNEDLRSILNAGHTRALAKVLRCGNSESDHDVREFDVWAAKVLAGIGKLPPTVQDRAITIPMRRRLVHEHVERIRQDRLDQQYEAARVSLKEWADSCTQALRDADPTLPEGLSDRARDNWRPLLSIADAVGGDWPAQAREAALLLNSSPALEEDIGTLLLTDLRRLFHETGEPFMLTDDVLTGLIRLDARPWATFTHDRPLTASGLARRLKEFGIDP